MNRIAVCVASVGLFLSATALARDAAQDERDLRRVEKALCNAFESGDGATLEKYLDEHFTLTNSRGEVTDRKQNIEEVSKRDPRYELFRNHDQKIRWYGDAAIITGITTIKGTADGKTFGGDFQFTDTWVYRDGAWKLAASHASRLLK